MEIKNLNQCERNIHQLTNTIHQRTHSIQEECNRLSSLLFNLRSWTSKQQLKRAKLNNTTTNNYPKTTNNNDHTPAPASPVSATFLKMDSELDKVLAKARRVRTGEQKVKSESESPPPPPPPPLPMPSNTSNKSSHNNHDNNNNNSTINSASLPPLKLIVPKSENSKRARYLQQLHGRIDLIKIYTARDRFVQNINNTNTTQDTDNATNTTTSATTDTNSTPTTQLQSQQHMKSFLNAISIARKNPVPEYVGVPQCATTSKVPMKSMGGDSLDTYITSIASRPVAEHQLWNELHEVGKNKRTEDQINIENKLQKIATRLLLPTLQHAKQIVMHARDASKETEETSTKNDVPEKVRTMLLLYRLTESMLYRRGQRMVRIGSVVDEDNR